MPAGGLGLIYFLSTFEPRNNRMHRATISYAVQLTYNPPPNTETREQQTPKIRKFGLVVCKLDVKVLVEYACTRFVASPAHKRHRTVPGLIVVCLPACLPVLSTCAGLLGC